MGLATSSFFLNSIRDIFDIFPI